MTNQSVDDKEFSMADLFFSRTDERGVIRSGNLVFQTISGFEWDELINAPHKIVRHQDMPKAVFQLLWSTIQTGEPMAAYVKNKTKSDGYYWVLAVLAPIEGGYLSVRMKPSTKMFEEVRALYDSVLLAEKEQKLSPEESSEQLLEKVRGLGFDSYHDFMARALTAEMKARDTILNRAVSSPARSLMNGLEAWEDISVHCATIFKAYSKIVSTPRNLEIQAAQLGSRGHPLAEISVYFSNIAKEMQQMLTTFNESSEDISKMLCQSLFLLEAARLQEEMSVQFSSEEIPESVIDLGQEAIVFEKQVDSATKSALVQLERLGEQIDLFISINRDVDKSLTALDVARIMCEIETASLQGFHASIQATVNELESFIRNSADEIRKINSALSTVKSNTNTVYNAAIEESKHAEILKWSA